MSKTTKLIIYCPPEPEELEEAAALLSERLGRDSEFEDGFGGLLKAIAKAYAHNLSREHNGGELDSDHKTE